MEAETGFRAMGTDVHVIVVGGSLSLLDAARASIERLEALWSRFREDSEISRLNRLAGLALGVSTETVALVQRSIEGARVTGGAFDPTVLGDVVRAGYDRTFEELSEASGSGHSDLHLGWEGIEVDAAASTVRLPSGVGFDPGGVGKGFAADLVVAELLSLGATGACANLGGDLRAAGDAPAAGAWSIAIQHPYRDEPAAIVGLGSGAVATSMRTRRTWGPAGDLRHHLIDPATGLPARTGIASATVIAAEGWQAEVLAKAAFLRGPVDGLSLVESLGADGLVVDDRGDVHKTNGFGRFTGRGDPTPSTTASPTTSTSTDLPEPAFQGGPR
jgi:FAD:protein FMN transferase